MLLCMPFSIISPCTMFSRIMRRIHAVLYLVLSLLVGGSDTIILFIIRNKMPVPPIPPYGGYPYPPQQYGQYMPQAGTPNGQPPQPGQFGQYMPPPPPAGTPSGQPPQQGQFGQYMPPPPAGTPSGQPSQQGQFGQHMPPPPPSAETPKEPSSQDFSDEQ